MAKSLKNEIKSLDFDYQIGLGQKSGIEYTIHTLRGQYSMSSANEVINKKIGIEKHRKHLPILLAAIKNSYNNPSNLVFNKKPSDVKNGQPSDPLPLVRYGLTVKALIKLLSADKVTQKSYAT